MNRRAVLVLLVAFSSLAPAAIGLRSAGADGDDIAVVVNR